MINEAKTRKELIGDATDRLLNILFEVRKSNTPTLSEKYSLAVRKALHGIVPESSMIGEYLINGLETTQTKELMCWSAIFN